MEMMTSTPACKGSRSKGLDRSRQNRFSNPMHQPWPLQVSGGQPDAHRMFLRPGQAQLRGRDQCLVPGLGLVTWGPSVPTIPQVKRVVLKDGTVVYCVWVTRDTEEVGGGLL